MHPKTTKNGGLGEKDLWEFQLAGGQSKPRPFMKEQPKKKPAGGINLWPLLLIFAVLAGCGLYANVTAQTLKARVLLVGRAVTGDLQEEEDRLRADLNSTRSSSRLLSEKISLEERSDAKLQEDVAQQRNDWKTREEALTRKIAQDETSLGNSRKELQGLRRKFASAEQQRTALQGNLGSARSEIANEEKASRQSSEQLRSALSRTAFLEKAYEKSKFTVKAVEDRDKNLEKKLKGSVLQQKAIADKVRHFQEAEMGLIRSLNVPADVAA